MTTIPMSEAREQFADLGNRVALRGERVIIERRGKPLFALVPVEDVEFMERLEDKMDLEAVRAAENEPSKPLEQVFKELGW